MGTSPCKTYGTQVMSAPISVVWEAGNIAGGVGQGHVLGTPGSDGITDGANSIQGVRTYDAVQGQWTTPDAFEGKTNTPITQKHYAWNSNNAADNADPSGFDPIGATTGAAAGYVAGSYTGILIGGAIVAALVVGNILAPEVFIPMEVMDASAGLLDGMETVAAAEEATLPMEGLEFPRVLLPFQKTFGAIGAMVGGWLGSKISDTFHKKDPPAQSAQSGFVFTYVWGDLERLDGTVVQYFVTTRVHDSENYRRHHGVMEDPSEGLGGSADQMTAALNGGSGMLDYCGSCDASGMNPFPGAQ